ncbi:MAG: hypothetical protein Q7K65_02375 [Candidatus Buchananbacteria bacterium]|nr:hypothetical protein [Candidatus Buchananbacteria bacterium]
MTQALSTTMSDNIAQPMADTLEAFKQGVDNLLAKRSYFISQVLPKLQENQDYYEIKGRKSLAKGGAEKLANIYNLTATFKRDDDTMNAFSEVKDIIAYVCNLCRNNQVVGQGRGAATLSKNQWDVNKTIKMSQKSSYIDAVIRTTGLSDIFTQDIENLSEALDSSRSEAVDYSRGHNVQVDIENSSQRFPDAVNNAFVADQGDEFGFIPATAKQKRFLYNLISQRYFEKEELEEHLKTSEGLSKFEASQLIEELLNQ